MLNLYDRETIAQITENKYLQYFLGYSSFIKVPPFDLSLFLDIRRRLGQELINEMNEHIFWILHGCRLQKRQKDRKKQIIKKKILPMSFPLTRLGDIWRDRLSQGHCLFQWSGIDQHRTWDNQSHNRPTSCKTNYWQKARKSYLKVAQYKNPSKKNSRSGIKAQLQYLRRNCRTVEK